MQGFAHGGNIDTDFDAVISGCAASRTRRGSTWINDEIRQLYGELFNAGHVHTVYSQRKAVYAASWRVSRNKVHVAAEDTAGESFEQFWLDSILGEDSFGTVGGPLRLYWDRDTDATYVTVKLVGDALRDLNPQKTQQDFVGLYDLHLNRLVEVP